MNKNGKIKERVTCNTISMPCCCSTPPSCLCVCLSDFLCLVSISLPLSVSLCFSPCLPFPSPFRLSLSPSVCLSVSSQKKRLNSTCHVDTRARHSTTTPTSVRSHDGGHHVIIASHVALRQRLRHRHRAGRAAHLR